MTFAREPLGPFFWGMALYVHCKDAWPQFRQGWPPEQRTFRLWHASHALFTGGADIVSGGSTSLGVVHEGHEEGPGGRGRLASTDSGAEDDVALRGIVAMADYSRRVKGVCSRGGNRGWSLALRSRWTTLIGPNY